MSEPLPPPPPDQRRVRIDLAYRGGGFHGWQQQPGLRTVQGELGGLVAKLLGCPATLFGAGRTDAGVHARRQVCHLDVGSGADLERLRSRLGRLAPPDLQILAVTEVAASFDARFSALARRYSYRLLLRRDVFREPLAWHVGWPLDPAAMERAAAHISGTKDFSSFCKRSSLQPGGNECRVEGCSFEWTADSAIFRVRANRFLHHMVRNLIGTLVEVGRGRRRPDDIPVILAARDRTRAGPLAPAHGLFLEEVLYPAEFPDPLVAASPGSAAGGPGPGPRSRAGGEAI